MFNLVHAFAVQDRVVAPERVLSSTIPPAEAIENIPVEAYIPSDTDLASLRGEMEALVQRILVTSLECFSDLEETVWKHIPHPFQEQSTQKSNVVSIKLGFPFFAQYKYSV